ncbi:AsmA family protein [Trichloromonas sp.]|uniref:DUF748 domain-containing protein n=1 Tax=Trichloromonas sp. TaxID=3069249 RepID=UPI002A42D534|nr:AsmA family protein [Trichloromonas sp.]
MTRPVKWLGFLFAFLVLFAVGLTVLVKTLMTPERIKARILPLAEQTLGREVRLGGVEIGLFSGIRLDAVQVLAKEGNDPLLQADQAVLRYRFWPLLQGRVEVDEVRLETPRITLIRQADGQFNISDLFQPQDDAALRSEPVAPPDDAGGAKNGLDLLISSCVINGGEFTFVDQRINAQAPYRYQISNLDVEATEISSGREFPFTVKARLNGAEFFIDGKADVHGRSGAAAIRLDNLDLTAFLPYFRDEIPGHLGSLKLDLDLTFANRNRDLVGKGKVVLRDIAINLNALPKVPISKARMAVDYDLLYDTAASRLALNSLRADLNGIPLELRGEVAGLDQSPRLDLDVSLNELELRSALNALPDGLVTSLRELDPAGFVTARVTLAGPVDRPMDLIKHGDFQLTNLQGSVGAVRPLLNGRITMEEKELSAENLQLLLGEDAASINFRIPDIFADPIAVTSSVSAERFQVDPLLIKKESPVPSGGQGDLLPAVPPPTVSEEVGPFDLPLRAEGEMRVKQALYQGMTIDDLLLRYHLADNLLTIETLSGQLAGGAFKQSGTVDLSRKGLAYEGRIELSSLSIDALTRLFAPRAQGTVLGALSLATDFKGRGSRVATLRDQLTAEGEFSFVNGRLTATPLTRGFAEILRLDELNELTFRNGSGNYRIRQGRLQLNSRMNGQDLQLAPTGEIGLDGTLALDLGARLSPGLSARLDKKGKIAGYFSDDQGWARLPLKLAGSFDQPRFDFDSTALKKQAGAELQRKLEEKVFKKLDASGVGKEQAEPAKQLMRDALQGLFGR